MGSCTKSAQFMSCCSPSIQVNSLKKSSFYSLKLQKKQITTTTNTSDKTTEIRNIQLLLAVTGLGGPFGINLKK